MNNFLLKAQWITAVALSVLVAGEWGYGRYQHRQLQNQLGELQVADIAEERLPVLPEVVNDPEQFRELVERPLFVEGRKPIETVKAQQGEAALDNGQLDEWELIGIYSKDRGQHYRALFVKQNDKHKQETLDLNQSIAGWTLVRIERDQVVVQQNGQSKTLFLYKPRKFAGGGPLMPAPHPMSTQGAPMPNRSVMQVPPPVPVVAPTPMNTEMINDAVSENQ